MNTITLQFSDNNLEKQYIQKMESVHYEMFKNITWLLIILHFFALGSDTNLLQQFTFNSLLIILRLVFFMVLFFVTKFCVKNKAKYILMAYHIVIAIFQNMILEYDIIIVDKDELIYFHELILLMHLVIMGVPQFIKNLFIFIIITIIDVSFQSFTKFIYFQLFYLIVLIFYLVLTYYIERALRIIRQIITIKYAILVKSYNIITDDPIAIFTYNETLLKFECKQIHNFRDLCIETFEDNEESLKIFLRNSTINKQTLEQYIFQIINNNDQVNLIQQKQIELNKEKMKLRLQIINLSEKLIIVTVKSTKQQQQINNLKKQLNNMKKQVNPLQHILKNYMVQLQNQIKIYQKVQERRKLQQTQKNWLKQQELNSRRFHLERTSQFMLYKLTQKSSIINLRLQKVNLKLLLRRIVQFYDCQVDMSMCQQQFIITNFAILSTIIINITKIFQQSKFLIFVKLIQNPQKIKLIKFTFQQIGLKKENFEEQQNQQDQIGCLLNCIGPYNKFNGEGISYQNQINFFIYSNMKKIKELMPENERFLEVKK